uniref:Integrase catalytic domain-containing protein n=1 Tax=Heterorhabditis bacteriophora TaxID=37862 RepID=A0A1I7X800_HETBA
MQKYDAIIKEQLTLDIIEPVLNDHKPDSNIIHYLAHHPVVNLQKSTTKVRIVYDASAKTRNNPSLNECLYRGPVLLPDLCGVLLRFRLAPIAISADVEKAFLQITLAPPDREVTRFLWLKDVTQPPTPNNIITYRFTRVPFGIISSPFLLGATIRYHLEQSETTIAHNLWRNLYVDNVFMAAKMLTMRNNYILNLENFLKIKGHHIPDISKILGIKWNISTDNLHFLIPSFIEKDVTKRNILKYIASIYDPLGFISPLFVLPKVFLQKLWKTSLSWDEKITTELFDEWSNISKYWNNNIISLRRSIKIPDDSNIQLHCFVDASGHTYGAVTYLRINHNNKVTTDILFTKNRLCPIQGMTIPKLELMALLVGSRMVRFLHEQLDITISETYIWSDSSCALHWLNITKDLPRFISNRVKEILKISDFTSFRHLPSQDNPADIITRGMIPEELVDSKLWWNGPSWLLQSKDLWPDNTTFTIIPEDENSEIDDTLVANYTHTAIIEDSFQLTNFDPTRYSSFSSMINILCYILFFIFKCTRKKNLFICQTLNKYYDNLPITVNTRKLATLFAFKLSQALHPPLEDDIRQWRLQKDEFGLWRSSSRLDLNNSTYDTKFPVFLHRSCYITHLFIIYIHNNLAHSGVNSTIANLRQIVWIPKARVTVRKCIKKLCMACRKTLAKPYPLPSMPSFPTSRVLESRPFSHLGVDYMGPLRFKKNNSQVGKIWICLITCLATRAIHCEVVFSLTAEAFLHMLRRFISRKGLPQYILSDNGTQFQLTSKILKNSSLIDYCVLKGIEWKFITELAPWQGGVYERLIGIFKQSFRRAVGRRLLLLDDVITITYEIEAVINSRPLTYYQEDSSYKPLRPIDFVLPGNCCISTPTIVTEKDEEYFPKNTSRQSLIKLWSQSQLCANNFWTIWRHEYLNLLREIHRYEHKHPRSIAINTPRVNDIVLIRDDNIPRVH